MDEFDFAPDVGSYQQFQPPPPAPDPYTSADDLRLQRLNQGLSHVQSEVDDGTLDPNEADELARMIHFQRTPLLAKQEAAKKMARSEQQQNLLEMNATQQSLMQADAANDARNFQARTATYTDPLTGRSKHFFQTTMGNWSPIDFDQETNPESGLPGGKTEGANEGTGEGAPLLKKNEDGTHTLEIYNGQNREVMTFDANGKTVSRQQFDREGREVLPQQAQQEDSTAGLTPGQLDELRKRAVQSNGQEPPPFRVDRFGRQFPNPDHRTWMEGVNRTFNSLVRSENDKARDRANNKFREEENRRLEAGRAEAAKRREELAKRKQQLTDDGHKEFKKSFESIQRRIDTLRDKGETTDTLKEKFPDEPYLWDRDAHIQKAKDDASVIMGAMHPDYKSVMEGEPKQEPKKEVKQEPQPKPDVRVGEGKWTPQQLEQEHQRRIASDPEYRKQVQKQELAAQSKANLEALPPDAPEERKWMATLHEKPVSELASLYDERRELSTKGDDMSGFSLFARKTKEEKIAKDEEMLKRRAKALGLSVERYKARLVQEQKITPQSIQRIKDIQAGR